MVNDPVYLCGGTSSIPGLAQWVKDLELLPLWWRSQLQLRFDPWPGNFHVLGGKKGGGRMVLGVLVQCSK